MPQSIAYTGTYDQIEQFAASVREGVHDESSRIDTLGVLERLMVLLNCRTGGFRACSLEVMPDGVALVSLSPYASPLRDNFQVAHELGHMLLHTNYCAQPAKAVRFPRYEDGPREWQANRFAAALLMPWDTFRQEYYKQKGSLYLLAGLFQVSVPAVGVRASYVIGDE